MNYGIDDVENECINVQLIMQYVFIEDVKVILDYIVINFVVGVESIGWGIWNEFGGNINVYEFDENGIVFYVDIGGNDGLFMVSCGIIEVDVCLIGLNVEWQVNDDLKLNFDYYDFNNEIDNGVDKGMGSNG